MEKEKIHNFKNNRTMGIAVVSFLIICLAMGVACFQYYKRIQSTVKIERDGYLQEISKQMGDNASRTINDNFSVLGTISTVIKSAGVASYEELQPIVLEQQKNWNYNSLFLIDEEGIAFDAYGRTVVLGGEEYLRDVIVDDKRAMSSSMVIDGKEMVVFAIPLQDVKIDGRPMHALAASYDLTTFDKILSMTAFDGKGYAHIIRKDGTAVVRSSSKEARQTGYNILNSLSLAEMDTDSDLTLLKTDIAAGKSGMAGYTLDGIHEYMVYTPLAAQEWSLLTFIPASAVNAKSELLMKVTLLLCGFITLAFSGLIGFLIVSFYRHKHNLEQIAYVDPVTHGNTIQRFYELAQISLNASNRKQYALVYVNIEKFKVLNEQFGRNACDEMLRSIERGIADDLTGSECSGHLFADNFCALVEYTEEAVLLKRFEEWYAGAARVSNNKGNVWLSPTVELGVYVIANDTIPYEQMIDRAKLALRETTCELHGRLHYAIYDDALRKQLFRDKILEDRMEGALANGEFKVYLQPKYCADDERIGGAEALVRWLSPVDGMIFPDEFISLFEKNGFIIRMDLWVFEEVCRMIRAWLDAGLEPVKVSVNCSRVHLKNHLFLEKYIEICERINIPTKYIEIELTENVVFEDVDHLIKTIDQIHEAGFGCSMDDFGSGYSSLNLIQKIPVDTLKLDKIFFSNSSKDILRTESVVGSIIAMSKALSMETVAEGIEERLQVDMLKRLGCGYIQGYYFAKPMPIADFENLAFGYLVRAAEADIVK